MGHGKAFTFLAVVLCLSAGADADVYKCTDDNGELKFQDSECAADEEAEIIDLEQLTGGLSVISKRSANRVNNAHFDKGLEFWKPGRNPQAFRWIGDDGHEKGGALAVQSMPPDNPEKRVIYEAVMSQCVKLDMGRRYRFAASFRPMGQYKSRHANRVNLSWYQSEDCSTKGQFANYLEPEPAKSGWQRIVHEHRLRSLNSRAALITIVQSRTDGNGQMAVWDDIELTPTEIESATDRKQAVDRRHTLPAGQNYIRNGDFRSDMNSWRYSGDTEWIAYEGGYAPGAARLAISSDNGGFGAYNLSQCVNIGASKEFRAGARIKVDPESTQEGGGIFRLSWYEEEDCRGRSQAGFKEDRVENIDGWQDLSIDRIEAPPNARSANIYMTRGVNDSGQFAFFIDDIFFRAVAE